VPESLEAASVLFATEVQTTLDGVLPGDRTIISRRAERDDRYVVRPEAKNVPLLVGGDHLADLAPAVYLGLDRTGEFLKAVRSEFVVKSVLDRTPLVRLDYRTDMNRAPVAHWQIHAERGAFSHLLSRAHAVDESRVGKPHDLSSLHFPVGGERFRPCLEDFLHFLVAECGVDARPGWAAFVERGREGWRRKQLRSTIRDAAEEAADVLRHLGWSVEAPTDGVTENRGSFTRW
jgi:hypothetical protein